MQKLTIIRPDDFHLHLRDGRELASVVRDSAARFARAIIMPNLKPPVVNVEQALSYRQRILACLSEGQTFDPMMTLYLTDNTDPRQVQAVADSSCVHAFKYYPAGATTNSDQGVTNIEKIYPVLESMAERGVPLLIHGEVTDREIDPFDREAVFIDRVLTRLTQRFPGLKIVFEHITTSQAVQFVQQASENIAATITPQHLIYNRSALFDRGLRPHYYCLPLLKRESHRREVVRAAVSGHPRFFLGTDSAPHARSAKESDCGCAGTYSAHAAIELYAGVFEQEDALDKLEAFASINGAAFYGLPRNSDELTLVRKEWTIPSSLPFADDEIVPLDAGVVCRWSLT